MAANKRNENQKAADRLFIATQLVKAYSIRTICGMLNEHNKELGEEAYTLTHASVATDIKNILEEWRDERKDTIDLVVDKELKKLDVIESECWQAWEKSKKGKRITKINGGTTDNGAVGGGKIKERSIEETYGDARYFDKIIQCMDRRRDLLGYAAPKKVEFSGAVGVGVTPMDEDAILKEKARIEKNLKIA